MIEVKKNIYNVGAIDWNLREFHGYVTEEGSTYNAYLIIDEQVTLIDTVKEYLFDDMIANISKIIDPSKIDNIISLHSELDHAGGVARMADIAPNAKIYASKAGVMALKAHFHGIRDIIAVAEDFVLNTGKYNFKFHLAQLLHWPDNMVAYLQEEKILFSNDAFGQHLASSAYFDDAYDNDGVFFRQLQKYYANILQCYGERVLPFAKRAILPYEIDVICNSHGLMIRKYVKEVIECYAAWASSNVKNKAMIVYDSMWGSTETIAKTLQRTLEENGVNAILCNLKYNHISDVMVDVLDSAAVLVGSPTLNGDMLPTVASFLCYFKGLMNQKSYKIVMPFGSFGWIADGYKSLDAYLKNIKGVSVLEGYKVKYVPTDEDLKAVEELALTVVQSIKERVGKNEA